MHALTRSSEVVPFSPNNEFNFLNHILFKQIECSRIIAHVKQIVSSLRTRWNRLLVFSRTSNAVKEIVHDFQLLRFLAEMTLRVVHDCCLPTYLA